MLQFLGDALPDSGMERCQMDRQIRIFVNHIHEYLAHIQCDCQFLLTFPNKRLLPDFAWLNLTAHKLPQQPLALWAGRWQIINLS